MPRRKPETRPQPRRGVAHYARTHRPTEPERVDDQRDEEEDVERLVAEGDMA